MKEILLARGNEQMFVHLLWNLLNTIPVITLVFLAKPADKKLKEYTHLFAAIM